MNPSQQSPNPATKDRVIRVFISSTFRDMQAERDYLVKFIFPQLRKLCESRGVTWGEVDLRWGVTDEQAAEGKVLPICLEEIKRCRPYFIGLLGERYGWIPDALPADLLEREPWLKEHLHGKTSVTELEILHGVLLNPQMAGQAYFYFRDPAFVNSIPEKDRKNFVAENADDAEKLRVLKENIRRSGFLVRENYPDPKALGELVLADLTKVINDLFPEGSQPDPLDREAMDHEAYAQSRERVYIGRQEYFDRLDSHAAANDTQPLVILGDSGSGKSALLANWVARYRQAHPDALVLQHYIGATPYSADWAAMLRRIMGEFKRRLGLQQDIPDHPDALRSAFPNWLYMAAAKGRVVLVLDALNQLEDRDGAPDLVWLPPVLPENVRIIVSTLPGRSLDEIQKHNWPTLKVELLSADERRKLIAEYLAQHAKALNAARVERIAAAPPSANPLYLRVLLDELRLVRTHEELEERISDYLKAESPYALYEKVIPRWEQDYGQDLVRQSLSCIWAARRGLSEAEILDLLGKDGQPLPRAKWSPFYLAAEAGIAHRSGLLNFFHEYLRDSVKKRYLRDEQQRRETHFQLASYFCRANNRRLLDEFLWQLVRAKRYEDFAKIAADPQFLSVVRQADWNSFLELWSEIEGDSTLTALDAYRSLLAKPESHSDIIAPVLDLLARRGCYQECLASLKTWIPRLRASQDQTMLFLALQRQGALLRAIGDIPAAAATTAELDKLWMSVGGKGQSHAHINQMALEAEERGDLEKALALHKEVEADARNTDDLKTLHISLGNQSRLLELQNDMSRAAEMGREAVRIAREIGNLDGLAHHLNVLAGIYYRIGDNKSALACCDEAEGLCRRLGNRLILGYICYRKASLLFYGYHSADSALLYAREAWSLFTTFKKLQEATAAQELLDSVRRQLHKEPII